MAAEDYPPTVETYQGYTIEKVSGYITNKLIARKDGDVHTRRFEKGSGDRYLKLLKKDIDRYGDT